MRHGLRRASLTLAPGSYYMSFQNAVSADGHGARWDINDGPSTAYDQNVNGIFPVASGGESTSNSFDIYGTSITPEPSSLFLIGGGLLSFAGMMRRKLKA